MFRNKIVQLIRERRYLKRQIKERDAAIDKILLNGPDLYVCTETTGNIFFKAGCVYQKIEIPGIHPGKAILSRNDGREEIVFDEDIQTKFLKIKTTGGIPKW